MTTVNVNAPAAAPYWAIQCQSGNSYVADVNGLVSSVPIGPDLRDCFNAGCQAIEGAGGLAANSVATATIQNAAVTSAKLANGAGVAALLAAGLGASASYLKSAVGALVLLALHASKDRAVLILVTIDQTFANGDGAQPTFKIGQTGTTNKFADTSAFTGKTAGTVLAFGGILSTGDDLLVTAVAGTGTTETGGLSATVLAIPTT